VELARLIEGLSVPDAYPDRPASVEVRQTHISVVFLAGAHVYKLRKPVALAFLDFSTPDARRADCHDEVRLNRRLARDVYVGVVPVVASASGLAFEGEGEPIEWAVKMKRLSDDDSLLARLARGELGADMLDRVADRIAAFHASAERPSDAAELSGFEAVARNVRENFDETEGDVGRTVSATVFSALRERSEETLSRHRPLIEERARRGVPCEGHGDLRLEHVYVLEGRVPPDDVAIIDCVEFSRRFRVGDPVADLAFLVMELLFHGQAEQARAFADGCLRSRGDERGAELLPFYVAYRSLVRAKVRGLELREPEIPEPRRQSSLVKARAHFLLALGELETPATRPLLVLVGGLPGTGKTTLARALDEGASCHVIRTDVVRKELTGGVGIYTEEWTTRTYDECRRRAEDLLLEGKRVIVDATFADEAHRQALIGLGSVLAVPVVWFVCKASVERARERLAARRGDASDADFAVHELLRQRWDPPSRSSGAALVEIDTDQDPARAAADAISVLRQRRLA
jgi:aminoglycoside phosphotransferase family enzyme/predicted kinase